MTGMDMRRGSEGIVEEELAAMNLFYPSICHALANWKSGDKTFIITELCAAGELKEMLNRAQLSERSMIGGQKQLGAEQVLCVYLTALLSALECCENVLAVHTDLKPDNILFCKGGNKNGSALIDFGLARSVARASGVSIEGGTLGYRAPEVMRGERGDCRSEGYSLGLVIFEMIMLRCPCSDGTIKTAGGTMEVNFTEEQINEWLERNGNVEVLPNNCPNEALRSICHLMLRTNRHERPLASKLVQMMVEAGLWRRVVAPRRRDPLAAVAAAAASGR